MSRRFRFRLQTLLRVRQLRQRAAQRSVAAKRAEIARLDRLNAQTTAEIRRQHESLLEGQRPGQLDPLALQRGWAWIACLRKIIVVRHLQRGQLAEELHRLEAESQAARTQARTIERLRERRWDQYMRDRNRRDQAAADELVQQLHGFDQLVRS